MKIYVKNNDISRALRVLKKKLLLEGDAKQLRNKEYYISTAEQRRIDEKAGRKRWIKKREKIEQARIRAEATAHRNRKKQTSTERKKEVA